MKNFNRKFEFSWDVPRLPLCDKDTFENEIIPMLIKGGAISLLDLEDGVYYYGKCRNATVARWDDNIKRFIYKRNKFGRTFDEEINHFEMDNGFDLFVPIRKAKYEEIE